ncbi:MAG: hypothetical protein AB7S38_28880 [Vulcanimicrobiota bacterium]
MDALGNAIDRDDISEPLEEGKRRLEGIVTDLQVRLKTLEETPVSPRWAEMMRARAEAAEAEVGRLSQELDTLQQRCGRAERLNVKLYERRNRWRARFDAAKLLVDERLRLDGERLQNDLALRGVLRTLHEVKPPGEGGFPLEWLTNPAPVDQVAFEED